MNIGILNIDSIMVNLPLMKISAFHKQQGDTIEWFSPLISQVDRLYASKIFNFSTDYNYYPSDIQIIKGGTGFDIKSQLPENIESITDIDYSIYPNCDYSIQLFSRGCIRACSFCVVNQKEGPIRSINPLSLNPAGKRIEILDNNFFANPNWKEAADLIKHWKQPVNFHGIDIRIINEEQCQFLNSIKHHKQLHIAWDNPNQDLTDKIKLMTQYVKPYKIMCYVLIGFNSTPEQDLYRVETLRSLNIDPFVMPYNKTDHYQNKFARWVNHKAIFKTVKWADYLK